MITETAPSLLPQHVAMLQASGIAEAVIADRGYRSVTRPGDLIALGFSAPQSKYCPALYCPSYDFAGRILPQMRPDHPPPDCKYMTPAGGRYCLDVHPRIRHLLSEVTTPLLVTEGLKKSDAWISRGGCALAITGVWMWRTAKRVDPKQPPLPDWDHIALDGRRVYICFDSDAMTKPEVHAAMKAMRKFLRSRGADVWIVYLPEGEDGEKVGLDDYLAQGHSLADVLALAEEKLRPPVSAPVTALIGTACRRLRGLADVRANGLRLSADLTDEETAQLLRTVRGLHGDLMDTFDWWLGDLYNSVKFAHGEKLERMGELLGAGLLSKARKCQSVVKAFPPSRRRDSVPYFWVYREIAAVSEEWQDRVLDTFEAAGGLTRDQVREILNCGDEEPKGHSERRPGAARPSGATMLPEYRTLIETLPAPLARNLARVVEVFGTEDLEDFVSTQLARIAERPAASDEAEEDDDLTWTAFDEFNSDKPITPNVPPAEHFNAAEHLDAEENGGDLSLLSSLDEGISDPPPHNQYIGDQFEAVEPDPLSEFAPMFKAARNGMPPIPIAYPTGETVALKEAVLDTEAYLRELLARHDDTARSEIPIFLDSLRTLRREWETHRQEVAA
jgi:hypothetical protein